MEPIAIKARDIPDLICQLHVLVGNGTLKPNEATAIVAAVCERHGTHELIMGLAAMTQAGAISQDAAEALIEDVAYCLNEAPAQNERALHMVEGNATVH